MNTIQNKRQLSIIQKYSNANVVREFKEMSRKERKEKELLRKNMMIEKSQNLKSLEEKALIAWKNREKDKVSKEIRKKTSEIKNYFWLNNKVARNTSVQDNKIRRKTRFYRPKMDPLPYLKKIREKLSKSVEDEDVFIPKSEEALSLVIPIEKFSFRSFVKSNR